MKDTMKDIIKNDSYKPLDIDEDCQEIVHAVADAFRVSPNDILCKRRLGYMINPRFAVYYLLYQRGYSLNEVSRACGRTDHGSVLYGIKQLKNRLETEKRLRGAVQRLSEAGYEL